MLPRCATVLILILTTPLVHAADADEPKGGPPEFKYLKFRSIGPTVGGRVSRACGVPGDPLTYYAATAAGGVWKSADGGLTWKPIFDDQPISSIGSIAVAPSDPNVIYVGSGEANIRGNVAAGNGIYKSTDAGKTWRQVWKQEGQIGTMIVHPKNADIAYAAVLGHAFGPNPERGVYRTTDGGKKWERVLFKNADTGASDVCLDPSNPRILFAGLWQARRRPWEMTSGGPGSGLYVSRDGGDSWKQLTGKGLPEGVLGKIGVAVAPSDPRRVYALIEAEKGGLYRSDDGGDSWELINPGHYLRQRAWYYSTLTIDPKNPDVIWCPQVRLLKSIDAGKTFVQVKETHHGDHHDIWIDPRNPRRIIDSNDGGVDISSNGGESWLAPALPICQFYHIAADTQTPYHVMGTMQDIGTGSGPSNSLASNGITTCNWHPIGGGETGFVAPDPTDPNIVYATEYGGFLSRFDRRTGQVRNISIYPTNPSGHGASDLRYRFPWTATVLVSLHDPKVIYHAANVLFRSADGGAHWSALSPDLTRNDKAKQQWSGGPITGDNTGAEYYCTISAVAESPREKGVIWVGSDDGLVHISRDSGKNWSNVTKNITGIPEWGTVACVEPSAFDAGTAYVVVDAHRLDDMKPYLFKTADFGKTWQNLSARLPQDDYLHAVREDPKQKSLLFVGTERGVSFSADDGATWQQLKLNLPTVAVHDLVVKENDLVLGTNGRSIWIFDDLTPLRNYSAKVAAEDAHLFPVEPAVRWRYRGAYGPHEKIKGDNPPRGALIHYYLKSKPKEPIALEILDGQGKVIRRIGKENIDQTPDTDPDGPEEAPKKIELKTEPGVHRIAWDLRFDGATVIDKAKWDGGDARTGPLVQPGNYSVRLRVEGKAITTTIAVRPDPRVKLAEADYQEEQQFCLALRDDISKLSGIVHGLRSARRQLLERLSLLKDRPADEPYRKEAQVLVTKLNALEEKLQNPRAEVAYDILAQRGGAQLYSRLIWLYDAAKDSDGAPTQGMREVYAEETRVLAGLQKEWDDFVTGPLAALNEKARQGGIPIILVPSVAETSKKQ
jgi:photosystem II stability/assembly factor-like uncharacterized protein